MFKEHTTEEILQIIEEADQELKKKGQYMKIKIKNKKFTVNNDGTLNVKKKLEGR